MKSESLTIGRIAFERVEPRVIRVVKAKERNESPEAKQRRQEIAILRIYAAKYPEVINELVLK